jgi:hypothetical protein
MVSMAVECLEGQLTVYVLPEVDRKVQGTVNYESKLGSIMVSRTMATSEDS